MAATKKAPVSAGTLTGAGLKTLHGSKSDFIIAQKVWNTIVEIWGQEHGMTLEVKAKEVAKVG